MKQVVEDDAPTICAIAILAACIATGAHFVAGHAGACVALGGRITLLTTVHFACTSEDVLIAMGGPIGSFAAGIVAWALWLATRESQILLRQLLLLVMAINLYWVGGGLFYSALINSHDWYYVLLPIEEPPGIGLRLMEAAAGAAVYGFAIPAIQGRALLVAGDAKRAWKRLALSWLAATLAATAAALLYAPHRLANAWGAAWEVGAWSLPLLAPIMVRTKPAGGAIPRSPIPIGVSLIVFAGLAMTLGAGFF